jgi:TPR repeat protein
MYAHGEGVRQDYAEALRWYHKAAEHGEAAAQFNLGLMYAAGQGAPQDYVQAHMWLNLAASRASGDHQKKYAHERDLIAGKMTAQQVAEAQRLAREWKPKGAR